MIKINLKNIGKAIEPVLEVAACSLLILASYKYAEGTNMAIGNSDTTAGYDKAVKAIMDSGMYSHDKKEAVSVLNTNGTAEFYKAIVYIAQSGMYSHEKLESIKSLSNK